MLEAECLESDELLEDLLLATLGLDALERDFSEPFRSESPESPDDVRALDLSGAVLFELSDLLLLPFGAEAELASSDDRGLLEVVLLPLRTGKARSSEEAAAPMDAIERRIKSCKIKWRFCASNPKLTAVTPKLSFCSQE